MAMKPEEVLKVIAAHRGDAICVPTMTTSPAWRELAPDDLSVGCVGFMGGASSLGLGLALARPERRVVVFDGDGSLLMQLGTLATVAGARPRNLIHLLFKNGVYHTSGAQEIPGGLTVDFLTMAKGAGYRTCVQIGDLDEFKRRFPKMLMEEGPIFAELVTTLADKTPMTDRRGVPFPDQVAKIREKLLAARRPPSSRLQIRPTNFRAIPRASHRRPVPVDQPVSRRAFGWRRVSRRGSCRARVVTTLPAARTAHGGRVEWSAVVAGSCSREASAPSSGCEIRRSSTMPELMPK